MSSSKKKIFIDGESGTTGLQIRQRLEAYPEVELLHLPDDSRKDIAARAQALNAADLAVLCLPDDAAREIVTHVRSPVKVLDSSTAHRTHEGWVYGMAELNKTQAKEIAAAQFVTNPGCYALCSIALLRPLIENGVVNQQDKIHINAISGYSGGGKKMIADYETKTMPPVEAYALIKPHKHLPEITKYSTLTTTPSFAPFVGNFRQGMLASIFLPHHDADEIERIYRRSYQGTNIAVMSAVPDRLSASALAGRDDMEIYVASSGAGCSLLALCDNLGKGAAGNALANIHLMLNLEAQGI